MTKLPGILVVVALAALVAVAVWMAGGDPFASGEFSQAPPKPAPEPAVVEAVAPPPVVPAEPVRPDSKRRNQRDIIRLGLVWLAGQQAEDGSWSSESDEESRPAVTGLVVLAFLGNGQTHKHGVHKKVVKAGLKYLKTQQRADGGFGPYERSDHAANDTLATFAMCEAYGMTGSPLFKQSAQFGVDRLVKRGISRVWDMMVLRCAAAAGLRAPETWKRDSLRWLYAVTEGGTGVASWPSGGMVPDTTAAQTAAAWFCRLRLEPETPQDDVESALKLVRAGGPEDFGADPGLIWFGSLLALERYSIFNDRWGIWYRDVIDAAGRAQEADGSWVSSHGSTRPLGRAGVTALALMAQSLPRRHTRLFIPRAR